MLKKLCQTILYCMFAMLYCTLPCLADEPATKQETLSINYSNATNFTIQNNPQFNFNEYNNTQVNNNIVNLQMPGRNKSLYRRRNETIWTTGNILVAAGSLITIAGLVASLNDNFNSQHPGVGTGMLITGGVLVTIGVPAGTVLYHHRPFFTGSRIKYTP